MDIADVSEWQGAVDWKAYAAGGYQAAVARLTYGTGHVDVQADANIIGMRAHLACRGYYGYLVAGQNAASQGGVFARVLLTHGGLQPAEWVAVDIEEGTGNQESRAQAWLATVNQLLHALPGQDFEYSGLNFSNTYPTWVPGVNRWVAAYQPTDPAPADPLWQFTDAATFPGITGPCDSSTFNGTVAQLLALIGHADPVTHPGKEFDNMIIALENSPTYWIVGDHRIELDQPSLDALAAAPVPIVHLTAYVYNQVVAAVPAGP